MRRTASVRLRAAVGSVVVVGIAAIIGAFAFVGLLSSSLTDGVATRASQDATDIGEQLDELEEPDLPDFDDERLVQLFTATGELADASDGAESVVLPRGTEEAPGRFSLDGDTYLVVSEDFDIDDVEYEVRAGHSLADAESAVAAASALLLVAVPVLLLIVGATTWLIVGRALSPVERIRRQVSAIEASDLQERVAVPGTGDEVSRLAATMNGMLARLERSHRTQRQFVSDASHELRSPIASIRQYAELAIDHPERADDIKLAANVLAEGMRLQDLVESLLLLTRLDESGPGVLKPVDLDDIALAEGRRLRDTTVLHIDTTGVTAARARGDERMLSRVLRNLADNAARHAHERLAISVEQRGARVLVVVDDDGPGIAESDRGRVFERFVRLDDGRARDSGGSGLGLAIVADIVRAHGGTVAVGTSSLGGARFSVELPGHSEK